MALSTSRSQTIGRAQVETDITTPGLVVAARPSNFKTPHVKIDKRGAAGQADTARALASFVPTLNSIQRRQNVESDRKDALLGQSDRLRMGETNNAGYEAYIADNNLNKQGARARAFMATSGRAAGHKGMLKYNEMIRDNQAGIITDEQFNTATVEFLSAELKGQEDPDFNTNYLSVFQNGEPQVRDAWAKTSWNMVQTENRTNLNDAMRGDFRTAHASGATNEDLSAIAENFYAQGKEMNLPVTDVQEMVFEALSQLAEDTQDTSIFGKGDGNLGFFDVPHTDANGAQVPGQASSMKWSGRIHDEMQKVNRSIASKKMKRNEMAVLDHFYRMQDAAKQGNETLSRQLNEEGLEQGLYKGSTAISNEKMIMKEADAVRRLRFHDAMYDQDLVWAADMSTKELQDTVNRAADDQLMEAQGDTHELAMAMENIRVKESRNGQMNSKQKNLIKNTNPLAQPQQFIAVHQEWISRRKLNPGTTINHIGNDADRTHMIFQKAREAGMDETQSLNVANQSSSPETWARMEAVKRGPQGAAIKERVEQELIKGRYDVPWSVFDDDVSGNTLVREQVMDNIVAYYALSNDMETAIEMGFEGFTASNRLAVSADGRSRWVDTKGADIPEDYTEAEQAFSEELKLSPEYSGDDYYWVPDVNNPGSQDWMVYQSSDDQPVYGKLEDGSRAPMRVNYMQAITERRADNLEKDIAESHEESLAKHAEHKVRQAEWVANQGVDRWRSGRDRPR